MTADEIAALVPRDGFVRCWDFRNCSICDAPVGYVFACDPDGEPEAGFDGVCDCSTWRPAPEYRTFDEVAETIGRQSPEVAARMEAELRAALAPKEAGDA